MTGFYLGFSLFLLLTLAGGLVRVLRGPTRCDRLLSSQLFGTTGVAILLVLAEASSRPALRDAALVIAVLAALNVAVFADRGGAVAGRTGGEP